MLTTGGIWAAVVRHNRVYNNRIGMFIVGNQSELAETTVITTGNLIEYNRAGILVVSGFDGGGRPGRPPRGGKNNLFQLSSQEDRIKNNTGPIGANFAIPDLGGGVIAFGGANVTDKNSPTGEISPSSGNSLVLQFLNTRFENNTQGSDPRHMSVFGYWTDRTRTAYGTDNQARVIVRLPDCAYNVPGFSIEDSVPADSTLKNKAYLDDYEPCANPMPPSTITSNFNDTPIASSNYVWFNANFKVSGLRADVPTTIRFRDSSVSINGVPYPVPSCKITFDPAASCTSTTFAFGEWTTVLPTGGSDEILLSGVRVPAITGIPGGARAGWSGRFYSDQPGVALQWKWGAAVYAGAMGYNAMEVKPAHTYTCGITNSDHAGTPEAMKSYLIGGARGGGGSNFTGGFTGTVSVQPKVY